MNRATVRILRDKLQAVLKDFDPNLSVQIGNARFTESNATFKVEIAEKASNGQVLTRDAQTFKQYHSLYGLPADGLGKVFSFAGVQYRVTGLNPKRPKFPVQAERVRDSKGFKFPAEAVRALA